MASMLLLLACTGPAPTDSEASGEPREVVDTAPEETVVLGCITGNARDDYNLGEAYVAARAFSPDTCEQSSEAVGNLGGDFCLDKVPEGLVEVQVLYAAGRCDWWHGVSTSVVQEGDCGAPETCIDVGVLYECYGASPVCDG